MLIRYLLIKVFFLFRIAFTSTTENNETNCNFLIKNKGTKLYLKEIFKKYGSSTNMSMTVMDFEILLAKINLGKVKVQCEKSDKECIESSHKHILNNDSKKKNRRKRDTYNFTNHVEHWSEHSKMCLSGKDLLAKHGLQNISAVTVSEFMELCPSLIQQIESNLCFHFHHKLVTFIKDDTPNSKYVWLYGLLSITIISLLSLSVIAMIPCLKKSFYNKVMAYLVALAVGTLAGDAMLHLIPHAFSEGANAAIGTEVSEEQKLRQHYSQVWRALFVLLGMYLFFSVEQLMKLKGGDNHGHSHSGETKETLLQEVSTSPTSDENGANDSTVSFAKNEEKAKINGSLSEEPESSVHHGHSHGKIDKNTKVSSLAWMVIVGDGFHNFSDGLAVGIAYSASLSSGLSTTIAVFCHELPHELGDFAVLIKSGMPIKQAVMYNLISALLAYLGLIVGILLGGNETGRHFILSLTAGLFLYVALADMLPELSHQKVPKSEKYWSFFCQHLGILSGIVIMLLVSLFEHDM